MLVALLVGAAAPACGGGGERAGPVATTGDAVREPSRLTASPGDGGAECAPGARALELGAARAAQLVVTPPAGGEARALLLVLHGAGQEPEDALEAFRAARGEPGLVLVAPASEGSTWTPWTDVPGIDRALAAAFARCPVDPDRIGVGGFSDGATYALSLGLENGDLFRAVIGLSPGGIVAATPTGLPRVFVAHGERDTVLPIATTGDAVVRSLRDFGYEVAYRRFGGGHEVPEAISVAAVRWFLGG